MVRPLPLPPDGVISVRRMAQIRRRHREKILKLAQRQKNRQEAAEQRNKDKIEKTTDMTETLEPEPEPEVKDENPNSPRRILREMQMQRLAKRKKKVPIENKEFYPDKLKRKVVYKKIKLTPNQELVPLGYINKRKRCDPKKGEEYEQVINIDMPNKIAPKAAKNKARNIIREESVEDIIMRIEEADSLTDEDLMEILTCPSPVWWEQPLNPFYFDEEPINKKLQKTHGKRQNQASIKQNESDNKIDKLEISLKNRDQTFVSKRSTLENILSQIKDNIEPAKNSQNLSRNFIKKRPWKNLDEGNPAFGLKRNSKGQFLKKKFGSSPITISDVSDREETSSNNSKNSKIELKSVDSDMTTPGNAVTTKTAETIVLTDIVKENSATNKIPASNLHNNEVTNDAIKLLNTNTSESNILHNNNITNDPIPVNESSIIKKECNEKKDLKEKDTGDSPKALIWNSPTGERKVITFTQDSEMSSDGVELVAESEDLEVPQDMPPLKWYPKTETCKESLETSEMSEASDDQLDDKNDSITGTKIQEMSEASDDQLDDKNDSITGTKIQEQEINIKRDSNIELSKDLDMSSQSDEGNEIPNENNSQNNESDLTSSNDTNYDTNNININDIAIVNGSDLTDSKANQIADGRNNNTDEKSTESSKISLFGVLEKAMDFFRKKSKDVALEGIEKDKKDYVVVYKIDETYKDTSDDDDDDISDELKQIGDELLEGDAVSETLDDFYNNIKNGPRKVLANEDD